MTVTVIRKKCRAIQYKGDESEPERSRSLGLWLRTSTNIPRRICKCYYLKIITAFVNYVVAVIANTCYLL